MTEGRNELKSPIEFIRETVENKLPFVKKTGLKVTDVRPGFVRCHMPLHGNENHINSMYAGALFTLAEIPGGVLWMASFDINKVYPLVKEMSIRFLKPAKTDIYVVVELERSEIERIQQAAITAGKAEFSLLARLYDAGDTLVAETTGIYQMRAF